MSIYFNQAACHGVARRAKTETTIPKISISFVFFLVHDGHREDNEIADE